MDNPKTVPIVISSYKYGHLAANAIDSVLSQTRKPDKIYFVDDGVGDCGKLVDIYPELTFILRPENLGTVKNFQDMLMRVDTDYVMFLGADNWLRPDTLEVLTKYDQDIIGYDIYVTGSEAPIWTKKIQSKPEMGYYRWDCNGKYHGSCLYNVEKAKKIGYRAIKDGLEKETQEDYYLFSNMIKQGARYKHVPEALLFYRRHRENFNPMV